MRLGKYNVKFRHLCDRDAKGNITGGVVLVVVQDLDGNEVAKAAKVSPKNKPYDKKAMRAAVLTKVLAIVMVGTEYADSMPQNLFSKEDRTAIWNDYNNRPTVTGRVEITITEGDSIIKLSIDNRNSNLGGTIMHGDVSKYRNMQVPSVQGAILQTIVTGLGFNVQENA